MADTSHNSSAESTTSHPLEESIDRQFNHWRKVMLDRILLFASILGAFPVIWGILNHDRFIYLYIGIYLFTVTLFAVKPLGYTIRVLGLLLIIYGIAVSEFMYGGITGGARIYLLSIILLAGIFLGLRAGFVVLGISLATIGCTYYLIMNGSIELIEHRAVISMQTDLWVHYVLGLLLMAGCILAPLGSLLRRLSQSLEKSAGLVDQLRNQIDEKERAQIDLMDSEKRYRIVAGNIMDIIWTSDLDLNFTFVSPSVTRLVGYETDDAIGHNILDTIFQKNRQSVQHLLATELKQAEIDGKRPKQSISFEMELPQKNGETIWTESRATFIRNDSGEPVEILGVTRDITLQKEAEEERRHLEIQIRQSDKLKSLGALAGGIAHDFNNILQAVFGYADLALVHTEDNAVAHEEIEQIKQAANRAHELVLQILMFGRQGEEEFHLVHLDTVVNEVLDLLRASLPSTIRIDKQVKGACDPVFADASQMHQVVVNLCTNAFHAMQETGGVLSVTLEPIHIERREASSYYNLSEGKYIRLMIRDTGHGLSPETAERIFEPFFTTKNVGEGTGLGLSTVHGIVMKHGGDITVDSTQGESTSFCVYLPVASGEVDSNTVPDETGAQGNEHVLFVDDEENLVALGDRALTHMGYHVTGVSDSRKALELFKAAPDKFQIVLTDQTMPNMTGTQLVSELQAIRPDIPVILISGYMDSIPREKALELGINTVLKKPVRANEISAAIRTLLDDE